MTDKIILIGGGGHAKVLAAMLKKSPQFSVLGYLDPKDAGPLLGFPYLGTETQIPALLEKHKKLSALIAFGKIKADNKRHLRFQELKKLGLEFPSLVAKGAIVNEGVSLGEGSVVMDGAVIQPGTSIQPLGIVNTGACIDHDCEIGIDVHVAPGATLSGAVKVGDFSLIGVGACVKQGIRVGAHVVLGAGAALVQDALEAGDYLGVPAVRKA